MNRVREFCRRETAFGNGLKSDRSPYRLEEMFRQWNEDQSIFTSNKGEKFLAAHCEPADDSHTLFLSKWYCKDSGGIFAVYAPKSDKMDRK